LWYCHSLLKREVALEGEVAALLVLDHLVDHGLLVHLEEILVDHHEHSPMVDLSDRCPPVVLPMDNNIELVMESLEKQLQ
jgi:hypothetical protein